MQFCIKHGFTKVHLHLYFTHHHNHVFVQISQVFSMTFGVRCFVVTKMVPRHIVRKLSVQADGLQPILGKHLEKFPYTMFRMLSGKNAKLKMRERSEQAAKGSHSFDYEGKDGKIVPLPGNLFSAPNGMSLRPNTLNEFNLISDGKSKFIAEIPKDTPLPVNTVLVHEFEDHFSLQPKVPMDPKEFDALVTTFLKPMKVYTRSEWVSAYPLGSQIRLVVDGNVNGSETKME